MVWQWFPFLFSMAADVCLFSIRSVMVGMGRGFLHDATTSVISLRGRLRGVRVVSGVGFDFVGGGSLGSVVFCA